MNDTIPIDSIKDKMIPAINLVPVLNKIFCLAQFPEKLEDRKLIADIYKTLLAQVVGTDEQIDNQQGDGVTVTGVAGEDLRRGFVYQGPDGLIYQARAGGIEHERT